MFARRYASKNRWLLSLLAIVLVLPLIFSSFAVDASAAQQCVVRNDWPVYIVQRGDTLARIASRYGTTYPVLMNANCLPNANRIFAGQQLRVPPGVVTIPPTVPPSVPIYPSDLAATYQAYEGGFMTWTVLTGQVSVYYYVSGTGDRGVVTVFPPSMLGSLPDNPVLDPTPAGRIRPVFGFGKVWGNFPQVRQGLGWAIAPEQGYLMRVYPPGSTTYQFSLPDGRVIYNNANTSWSTSSGFPIPVTPIPIPTVPPTPAGPIVTTTWAAYQLYEAGFMIWENNTGNVVAFYNNGSYTVYRVSQYGRLPDNPVLGETPLGRIRPAFGFGKVWGNYPEVRNGLGWALITEQGYTASFRSSVVGGQSQTCFLLPDGRPVSYALRNGVRYWTYSATCA